MLSSAELWALNRYDVRPSWSVSKSIFNLRLWRPSRQRLHSQRLQRAGPGQLVSTTAHDVSNGTLLPASMRGPLGRRQLLYAAQLSTIILMCSLRRYRDVARRLTVYGAEESDAARLSVHWRCSSVNTMEFCNHRGLAFIYRDDIKLWKRSIDVVVTTFE